MVQAIATNSATLPTSTVAGKVLTGDGSTAVPAYSWAHQQNRLYNSSAAVWQRQPGTESTDTSYSDDTYSADGFNVLTQTASVQCSRQTGDTRSRYCYRLKQNQASAQRMGFCQILEAQDCIDLRGEAVRFQGRIKCSSSQAIRWAIVEWTGTADSPVSDPVNDWTSSTYTTGNFFKSTTTTVTAVGSATPSAATWTAFSLTGTVSSSCNNLMVMVWTEGTGAQNVTLDVAELGLYLGAEGKLWVPPLTTAEVLACQRYYYQINGSENIILANGVRVASTTITGLGWVTFPVAMRTAPTVSWSSPSWVTAAPSGNQISFNNFNASAFATLTGALSNGTRVTPTRYLIELVAATSFSGSQGQVGSIYVDTGFTMGFSSGL